MPQAQVWQSVQAKVIRLPVSGAGSDVPFGTLLMPGVTGGTNKGVLIPITATSNARVVGILDKLHSNANQGDATTATLVDWFPPAPVATGKTDLPSDPVQLIDTATLARIDYDQSSGSQIAVASASGAALTITSYEANRDGSYVYVVAGTGIGQLLFVASSASGTCTLTSAATTQLDATSKLLQILPFFYETPVWLINTTTVPALLGGTAAAGTGRGACLGQRVIKNGYDYQLSPKADHNTSGLNSLAQLVFYSLIALQNTVLHPNS